MSTGYDSVQQNQLIQTITDIKPPAFLNSCTSSIAFLNSLSQLQWQ
uniref:Uncharacterized protein n=1 Tax=Arundo donax TaxID=35708 RepID=A0A0A8Y458_ARUDO